MPVAGENVDVVKYMVFSPLVGFTGAVDDMALYAGESAGLVHDIKPAAQVVRYDGRPLSVRTLRREA